MTRSLTFAAMMVVAICAFAQAQQPAAPAAEGRQGGGRQGGAREGGAAGGARQGGGPATRPPLFLKEEWANPQNAEHPIAQDAVANQNLELKLYGTSSKEIQVTGSANNENNPTHPWTGLCTTPCGVALRDKTSMADLTGLARIRWNIKTSGFHEVRPFVKLADGNMYVGDRADASTRDWLWVDFNLADVRWLKLDMTKPGLTTGSLVPTIDLSKVDEVGFIDLMPGSGHGQGGWVDVAQFEVYGKKVAR